MPAESDESPRRSSAVSHGSSNLTASTAFALEAVEAEHQGLWWYKMAAKALLIFPYPAHEQEFEESWSEPAVLVQPMVVYSLLWYSGGPPLETSTISTWVSGMCGLEFFKATCRCDEDLISARAAYIQLLFPFALRLCAAQVCG